MDTSRTIIFIGPICTGKSTISQMLAESHHIPYYSVDEHRWDYYKEIGYDEDEAGRRAKAEGSMGVIRYWKPFEAHAVERILATQSNAIIDFGAGHSVYEDAALFERVQKALAPHPHVILLLPSDNEDESVSVVNARFADLLQREMGAVDPELLKLNESFVRHPSNRTLAKMIVYTNGKTLEEIHAEVVGLLKL